MMDVGKPTTLADDWERHWASFDESASVNPAQHYRHRLVVRAARSFKPRRLVDIGSGQGDMLGRLSRSFRGTRLFGLELSRVGVVKTFVKAPAADVRCVNLLDNGATTAIADVRADVAICCEVLEHLDDPVTFLRTATSALAPGATLIITVPSGPRSEFDRMIGHRRHYTPSTLRQTLQRAGFVVTRIEGAGFPFFNLYRLVVIGRGKRLAADVADESTSRPARIAMRAFDLLFRLNLQRSRWGWQLVAIATWPTTTSQVASGD